MIKDLTSEFNIDYKKTTHYLQIDRHTKRINQILMNILKKNNDNV